MVLQELYGGFQDIDMRVLKFYRKYAEQWEQQGHGRYGILLFSNFVVWASDANLFYLNIPDFQLNLFSYLLTTKEPEKGCLAALSDYASESHQKKISFWEYLEKGIACQSAAITTPLRLLLKKLYLHDSPLASEGVLQDMEKNDPFGLAIWKVNNHLRLPMLAAGISFLGKGIYDLASSLYHREPLMYSSCGEEIKIGLGFLLTASSAYFKDGDNPQLGKKQQSLLELLRLLSQTMQEKLTIKIPQPVKVQRNLEERLTHA